MGGRTGKHGRRYLRLRAGNQEGTRHVVSLRRDGYHLYILYIVQMGTNDFTPGGARALRFNLKQRKEEGRLTQIMRWTGGASVSTRS